MTYQRRRYIKCPPPEAAGYLLWLARLDPSIKERAAPAWFGELVRDILNPPMFPSEHAFDSPEIIEISAAEWAQRSGYTVQHVRRLCRAGQLPARRAGRNWWIRTKEHDGHDRDGATDVC